MTKEAFQERLEKLGWGRPLAPLFSSEEFSKLRESLRELYKTKKVFPPANQIFRCIESVPYNDVKVVILGQDPYHGQNQANGFAFAVNDGVMRPPSLRNILKEVERDGFKVPPKGGSLEGWADQGVLLLNTSLTVEEATPGSHMDMWGKITDGIILALNNREKPVIFMLWGNHAKKKSQLINRYKHAILESGHPSPLSYRHFCGCEHFKKANEFLEKFKQAPIDWGRINKNQEETIDDLLWLHMR